jgi:type III restriction enzyme
LKRIAKQWLDTCLVCKGGTYPAQLMYQALADMACERITAGITRALIGERPIKAVLDPYNPTGSTKHVNFNTSKKDRWETNGPPPAASSIGSFSIATGKANSAASPKPTRA